MGYGDYDDYHTECIPYHTSKKHLFVYLGSDTPYNSGWDFIKSEFESLTFEGFINTLYEHCDDDLFDILAKCENGTMTQADIDYLVSNIIDLCEGGNVFTRVYISKEPNLDESIQALKKSLCEFYEYYDDPSDLIEIDEVVQHHTYFKYGEYYFFWFGADTLYISDIESAKKRGCYVYQQKK